MKTYISARAILFALVIISLSARQSIAERSPSLNPSQTAEQCSGPFAHKSPTEKELKDILSAHMEWLNDAHRERGKQANLCLAKLTNANFTKMALGATDWREANFRGATMQGVDLNGTDLRAADMRGSNLTGADLRETSLGGADLTSSQLGGANLSGSNLTSVIFDGAEMSQADLSGAMFSYCSLKGAALNNANVSRTVFLLRTTDALPFYPQWQFTRNLSEVIIAYDANTFSGFQKLRTDFKMNGMRRQERAVTAALERAQMGGADSTKFERIFRRIAFDWTVEYGNAPGHSLVLLLYGTLLFAIPYAVTLSSSRSSRGGIWRVWDQERLIDRAQARVWSREPPPHDVSENASKTFRGERDDRELLSGLNLPTAILYGIYFSILSTFQFGWRELSVGAWIIRAQPREYVLKSSGWVRFVSGTQSIFSLYLVALWVLFYFGRPFG